MKDPGTPYPGAEDADYLRDKVEREVIPVFRTSSSLREPRGVRLDEGPCLLNENLARTKALHSNCGPTRSRGLRFVQPPATT